MVETTKGHNQQVVDQFGRQAVYFAKLPNHKEATQLLLQMAGIEAAHHVLDVACGAGSVACAAAQVAREVTGIDLTPAMIEHAAALQAEGRLSNVRWQIGDVSQLPYAADQFDVVLTRYSLHHFLHPVDVLAEMVRVCKPSGRVAVADLVLPAGKVAAYDQMERLRDPSHVRVLTEVEVHGLLTNAGLVDLQWTGYLFDLELSQLLQASFPRPGAADQIREIFEADIGVDELGIGVRCFNGEISFAYPIAVAVGTKPGGTNRST